MSFHLVELGLSAVAMADSDVCVDGFFDAGMLLQALKASQEEKEKPSEKAAGNARREIGKKLRVSEY